MKREEWKDSQKPKNIFLYGFKLNNNILKNIIRAYK
jgi:hypothetical protein